MLPFGQYHGELFNSQCKNIFKLGIDNVNDLWKATKKDGRIFVFVLIFISLIILWEKKIPHVSSSVFALVLGMCVSQVTFLFQSTLLQNCSFI